MSLPHEPLPPGTEIAGHRIIRKIGQGGFGIVYEVHHRYLGRRAMKEFFCSGLSSRVQGKIIVNQDRDRPIVQKLLRRFIETGQVLNTLSHPALLKVHHIEEANGTAYMFTDYVDGGTLLTGDEGPIRGIEQFRAIFEPVMDALEYCHGKGVLHRDIKPDNIMLRSEDRSPVLIDFGAVKQLMRETAATQLTSSVPVVSERYAPPEQRIDPPPFPHGPYTDIYALGATMYQSLTGRLPADSLARSVAKKDLYEPLLSKPALHMGRDCLEAIDKALPLDPVDRWQSIGDMRSAMRWPGTQAGASTRPLKSLASAEAATPRSQATPSPGKANKNLIFATIVAVISAIALVGSWIMGRPDLEHAAEIEYATISASTDSSAHTSFAARHPSTRVGQRAKLRAVELQRLARAAAAAAEWARLKDSTDEIAVERFIEQYGDLPLVAEARVRLAELRDARAKKAKDAIAAAEWARLKVTNDEMEIEKFISRYEDTPSSAEAKKRLAEVRREKTARAEAERQRQAKMTKAADEWSRIKDTSEEVLLERFISSYGDLPLADEARQRLASLQASKKNVSNKSFRVEDSKPRLFTTKENVIIRTGPGLEYPSLGVIDGIQAPEIDGIVRFDHESAVKWYRVKSKKDSGVGYISAEELTSMNKSIAKIIINNVLSYLAFAKQNNKGPFASNMGLYMFSGNCEIPLPFIAEHVMPIGSPYLVWFEGDKMYGVWLWGYAFNANYSKDVSGTALRYQRTFNATFGAIRIYQRTNGDGSDESIAFINNALIFNIKEVGRQLKYDTAKRCEFNKTVGDLRKYMEKVASTLPD